MRRPTKSHVQYLIGVCLLAVLLLSANVARGQNTISTVPGVCLPIAFRPRLRRSRDRWQLLETPREIFMW